ncbi:hypothetical protein [Candidatus Coxiella mudrowiae]|uniref:hypothetical protein n=1 Tax=Candidatus Coxiella mudrowiae TaxID=2054173 RepID=UPI000C284C15|nr:hypothetical protein [Candidatus Coxiella mudrowiae]
METEAEGIEWKGSWFSFFKDFYRKFFQIYATIMNGGGALAFGSELLSLLRRKISKGTYQRIENLEECEEVESQSGE